MSSFEHINSVKLGYNRYVMVVEYDGSKFFGWQRQDNLPTVQALIEDSLTKVVGRKIISAMSHRIVVYGSGRTDAGVHALGQVAHFDIPCEIDCDKIQYGLNFFMQQCGASVLTLQLAPSDFHARFSALEREYRYVVLNRRAPSMLLYEKAWHVSKSLNIDLLQMAANQFLGLHDFTSFRDSECQAKSPVRSIEKFKVSKIDDCIFFDVQARSFLHHQVRIMVGTIVYIGLKDKNPLIIEQMLAAKARKVAGPTAPANGLFFLKTRYPQIDL